MNSMSDYMRWAREDIGYSRRELSELSGVPLHTITDWETKGREPKIRALMAVVDALETTLEDYIGYERKNR